MKYQKLIVEQLEKNLLKENTTGSVEGRFEPLIMPLIKKLYLDCLICQIADVQPLTSPTGKIGALYSTYSGSGSSAETGAHPDSSFIVVIEEDISALSVGDTLTLDSDSSTFDILYIEEQKVLVARNTGTGIPTKTDTFNTTAYTITFSSFNRAAIKKLFHGYSGTKDSDGNYISYNYGYDDNTNVKYLGFESRTVTVTTGSRKIKSKFSWEQLDDLLNIYKEDGIDVASEFIANDVRQEIDKEFISYMKFIAKYTVLPPTKINLAQSIAVGGGGLKDVTDDLIVNVFLAAEQIVRDTKRNRTIFVLADPITAAFLQTNALVTKAVTDEENPYKVGNIGIYPLFCDLYSEPEEYFILVGYMGDQEGDGDSGLIYTPYSTTLHVVPDKDMKQNLLYLNRYKIVRHPQDTGNLNPDEPWNTENANNSDFFKMMIIDYGTTELKNFANISIPNFE